jgi:hypothetical protein
MTNLPSRAPSGTPMPEKEIEVVAPIRSHVYLRQPKLAVTMRANRHLSTSILFGKKSALAGTQILPTKIMRWVA